MEGIVTLQRRLRDRAEAQTLRAFTPWLKPGAPTGRRKAAQLAITGTVVRLQALSSFRSFIEPYCRGCFDWKNWSQQRLKQRINRDVLGLDDANPNGRIGHLDFHQHCPGTG
jgi:hypothetical protein